MRYLDLVGFGPSGWGAALLIAAAMTVAVSLCGFAVGGILGIMIAWAKIAGPRPLQIFASTYTTVLRGIPDLLVIYLFYFGSSIALTRLGGFFGTHGFIGAPAFVSASLAIGVVSSAYQAEVFRGAYRALNTGELMAARSVGMNTFLMFRRVVAPLTLRIAIPGLGNLWQIILKDSALVSVTGLMELLHQTSIAAGATYRPFDFYLTAMLLFLFITWVSSYAFVSIERHSMRGIRRQS